MSQCPQKLKKKKIYKKKKKACTKHQFIHLITANIIL